jgi:hypothetical protein
LAVTSIDGPSSRNVIAPPIPVVAVTRSPSKSV